MAWFFITLTVLAIIYFAIVSEGFRTFIIVVIVICVAGGTWLFNQDTVSKTKRKNDAIAARAKIGSTELLLQDLRLSQSYKGSDSFTLTGLVTNNSRYPVKHVSLTLTLQSCNETKTNCIVVGENKSVGQYDSLDVPPNQARQLVAHVRFDNLPPLNTWHWHYTVNYVESE